MSVTLALFGGWVIAAVLVGLYFLLGNFVSLLAYFAVMCGLLLVFCCVLLRWLLTKGTRIFSTL